MITQAKNAFIMIVDKPSIFLIYQLPKSDEDDTYVHKAERTSWLIYSEMCAKKVLQDDCKEQYKVALTYTNDKKVGKSTCIVCSAVAGA